MSEGPREPLDSGAKMGLALLAVGAVAVVALMMKLRGHPPYEGVLGLFLGLQCVNAWLIVRGARRG